MNNSVSFSIVQMEDNSCKNKRVLLISCLAFVLVCASLQLRLSTPGHLYYFNEESLEEVPLFPPKFERLGSVRSPSLKYINLGMILINSKQTPQLEPSF